jgi:protein SERAC1
MIDFIYKAKNKNLIIFIHGLTGSNETWKNEVTNNTFPDLLLTDTVINNNFDMAYFEYFSSFLNIKEKVGGIKSLFSKDVSSPKNISINEISNVLNTRIDYELEDYDNIILIGHSMGGLIAKRTILKYIDKHSKIKLFLSLAVPHLGSELATYGDFVTNNIQVAQLRPLSDETISLTSEWMKRYNLPTTKYFRGVYEGIVNKNSSVPMNTKEEDILNIDENHRSISKPKDANSIVIKSTIVILKDFLKNVKVDDIDYDFITDSNYDDEYFVLKLLIADVHQSMVKNSKKHFYYSEAIRKIFTSKQDLLVLKELYAKIESIYFNTYALFTSKKIDSSTELVSIVHDKIIEKEQDFLATELSKINGLHKQGMIHQLANDISKNISWSDPLPTIEDLNNRRVNNV